MTVFAPFFALVPAALETVTAAALLGTGVFLTVRTRFLSWRNLGYALRCAFGRESRCRGSGGISPRSALMTMLAATIGTGNIVGVATAITAGGPGALVWMELSALFGLTTKFAECMLAVEHRQTDRLGALSGGPMYVLRRAFPRRRAGRTLAAVFSAAAVLASFGIGDITQANSIAGALHTSWGVPAALSGAVTAGLTLAVITGGIGRIARVSDRLVPLMAGLYLLGGTAVIFAHLGQLPQAVAQMISLAFTPRAAAGGAAGTAGLWAAARYGVARGVFSNEAGMGSAAITAASAATDSPVRQGYISMTSVFFDTLVVCTVTGLAICCSGAAGSPELNGAALTIRAFASVLGPWGGVLVTVCILLFAFTSMLGWAYQGEKALEYLAGRRPVFLYRLLFALAACWGAGAEVEAVFRLSDWCNALMAAPNLACLLALSGAVAGEMRRFQPEIRRKRRKRL